MLSAAALFFAWASLTTQAQTAPSDIVDTHVYYRGEEMPYGLSRHGIILFDCAGAHLHLRLPRDSARHEVFFRGVDRELAELSALGVLALRPVSYTEEMMVYSLPVGGGTHWTTALARRRLRQSIWIFGRRAGSDALFVRGEVAAVDLNLVTPSCLPSSGDVAVRTDAPSPLARFGIPSMENLAPAPPPGSYERVPLPPSVATRGVDQDELLARTIEEFRDRHYTTTHAALDAITALGRECGAFDAPTAFMTEAENRIPTLQERCPALMNRARRSILADCEMSSAMSRSFYSAGGSRAILRDLNAILMTDYHTPGHMTDDAVATSFLMTSLLNFSAGREAELARFSRMNHCTSPGASADCAAVNEEIAHGYTTACTDSYVDGYLSSTIRYSVQSTVGSGGGASTGI